MPDQDAYAIVGPNQSVTQDMMDSAEVAHTLMVAEGTWPSLGTFAQWMWTVHPELSTITIRRIYHWFV